MKTIIEVQFNGSNVTDKDLDKFVKETLKAEGVKTTDVETLNVYYVPETANVFYVAKQKDGNEIKGELNVNNMPVYAEEPAKKAPAKKAPAKKAPAKKAAAKEEKVVATKAAPKTAAKAAPKATKVATKTTTKK